MLIGYLVLIGGTPVGELSGWSQAATGVLGLAIIVLWLRRAPRAADRLDIALIAALLLFLVSAVLSILPRQSLSAATQATALAGGFYLARRELAGATSGTVKALLGWTCLLVLAVTLPAWLGTWISWLNADGWSNPPPLSVWLPPGVFDNRHYVGTLVILLAPALWSDAFRRRWLFLAVAGTIGTAIVVLMDASRTLIVAAIIASLLVGAMHARRITPRLRHAMAVIAGTSSVALLVAAALAAPVLLERFGNLSKLLTRFTLWDNAFAAWLDHPVAGVGPGVYPLTYFLNDYFAEHSFAPRHPDNAAVQLLAEAGLLGLAAAAIVVVAIAAASGRQWGKQPAAVWSVTAFLVACIGTNPSDFLFLLVPALLWAAMLTPADNRPVQEPSLARPPSRAWRHLLTIAVIPVGAAILLTSGASIAFQTARDRYASGDSAGTRVSLDVAVTLDPGEAFYWRERAGLRLASGDPRGAREDFKHALELLPFDPGSMRGLSLAHLGSGDASDALASAEDAIRLQRHSTASAIVLAVAAHEAGAPGVFRRALSDALLGAPYFALVPWADTVLRGIDAKGALEDASHVAGTYRSEEVTIGPVLVVLMAGAGDALAAADEAVPTATHTARALAAVAMCDAEDAIDEIRLAGRFERESGDYWIASGLISQVFPESGAFGPQFAAIYRGLNANGGLATSSLTSDGANDALRYRRVSLDIRAPDTAMPGLFRGSWLLTMDPLAALSALGQRPPDCVPTTAISSSGRPPP